MTDVTFEISEFEQRRAAAMIDARVAELRETLNSVEVVERDGPVARVRIQDCEGRVLLLLIDPLQLTRRKQLAEPD